MVFKSAVRAVYPRLSICVTAPTLAVRYVLQIYRRTGDIAEYKSCLSLKADSSFLQAFDTVVVGRCAPNCRRTSQARELCQLDDS